MIHSKLAVWIKPDSSRCRIWPSINPMQCEPERETNCRFSIRNYQIITVNSGYKRIPFHFSGPKGRRFKSCHLDQSLSGNVISWQAFFYPLHKNGGFCRIAPKFDTPGWQPILFDKCTLCLVAFTEHALAWQKLMKPKGQLCFSKPWKPRFSDPFRIGLKGRIKR